MELHADAGEEREEVVVVSQVALQVPDTGSPQLSGMQSCERPSSGGGGPDVELRCRSPLFSTEEANAGRKEKKLKLLCSPEMRRRSSRLIKVRGNGSNLLELSNSSEKKACDMIRMRLGGSNLAGLNEKSLRSRSVPHQSVSEGSGEGKRKRKLDSSRNSNLSQKSLASKKEKLRANSAANGSLERSWMLSCSNGTGNGNWAKILEDGILRRSSRSLSADMANESPKVNSPATVPKKDSNCYDDSDAEEEVKEEGEREYNRCFFIGEPVLDAEARQRWPWRFAVKSRGVKDRSLTVNDDEEDKLVPNVEFHYTRAQINECIFELGDCAYMRGENGQKHIGRIIEFFRSTDEKDYCRVQWFYRAEDTIMKGETSFHDKKRLFYSTIMNDNSLDCVISKLKIVQLTRKLNQKSNTSPRYDYYYDMEYCLDYSTFRTMPTEGHDLSSPSCDSAIVPISTTSLSGDIQIWDLYNKALSLLDLYSGCGAMSTGLCLGAKMSGVNLVTRWAVDFDKSACESLRMNHPKSKVRNESAEDFLELLKQWEKLCKRYAVDGRQKRQLPTRKLAREDNHDDNSVSDDEEFEVERLLDICYGDLDESGKQGLKFKVHWKGYDSDEDTWEPIEGLRNCGQHIHNFVTNGLKSKILPLPGDADVICGGPPCQGISGYNRFRSVDNPFDDDRNRQLQVFMDIVKFLKPRYVLMENVMDILKFDKGSLGRYALSRLVHMNYQARVGIMAAGCYGLPQFRLRAFFWGTQPTEDLPQFPLPTHDCIIRYWPPPEFERNVVAFDEGQSRTLQDAVLLHDAISDLPAVGNDASADEMPYGKLPETEFQAYIRSIKCDMMGGDVTVEEALLYDHRPYPLHEDDYIRVCHIPRRKGANFRDLPGIIVGDDNVVRRDPTCENAILPSGKPMVPDYALKFEQGKSRRPFGRMWWDETASTVTTSPTCHSQVTLHPEQDRVLTVRECARLQGFPDHYRFSGTVKKRYRQIGNAVPIPVAKALGYALGMASQKLIGKEPLMELPPKFAYSYSL